MANLPVQLSPGVNTTEIDLTTIIPSVSSSVGALGGVFHWGPVEDRQLVTSEDELAFFYGMPDDNNFETWFTAASHLAYNDQLIISRAAANCFTSVAGPAYNANTVSALEVKNVHDYEAQAFDISANGGNYYVAKYPGALGNSLRISVCDSNTAFSSSLAGNSTVNVTFSFTIGSNVATLTCIGPDAATANAMANTLLAKVTVGDLLQAGNTTIGFQGIRVNAKSVTTVNTSTNTAVATLGLSTIMTLSSNVTQNTCTRFWEFATVVDNAPTTTVYTAKHGGLGDELHAVIVDDDGLFSGVKGEVLEVWANLSRATDALGEQGGSIYYKDVLNHSSRYVYWANDRSASPSGLANTMAASVNITPLSLPFYGGADGYDEATIPLGALARAYDQFRSSEDVDVSLVMTGKSRDGVNGEGLGNYLIDNIAEYRKDCVVFVSPDQADVVQNFFAPEQAVVNFSDSIRDSSYAVVDSGYKYMYDKYNDIYRWVPLNGDIAGLCAATDKLRDPWWSPAGFNRGFIKNVVKLAFNPDKARRDVLYPNNVNPVVTFRTEGTVLYGDKTHLRKPSAFDRINVRRLFIVLRKAISEAAKYTLFEFNDAFTRAQFRNMVEPYLRDVQGRRGIYDFKVVCDETNNTPDVIDSNYFVGDIYIKPARSINYIQLNFVAVRTGVDFNEIVGKF